MKVKYAQGGGGGGGGEEAELKKARKEIDFVLGGLRGWEGEKGREGKEKERGEERGRSG